MSQALRHTSKPGIINYPRSAHQLRAMSKVDVHRPKDVWKGYIVPHEKISATEAYFAHIRFGSLPEKGC